MHVIRAGWVLAEEGLRARHAVVVDEGTGRIIGVEPAERHPEPDVDLPGCLLMPGLVNAHSHAFQRAFRGHAQHHAAGRDDFWTWRDRMYVVANGLPPEGVEAVSRLAFLEMAEAGISRVGEFHYLHHRPDGGRYPDPDELALRVVTAAHDVGIQITLLRVAYLRDGPGRPLRPEQMRFGDASAEEAFHATQRLQQRLAGRADVGLAPHSVRALTAHDLEALGRFEGIVHAHVAEQPAEVQRCLAEHGAGPLRVFDRAGLLHERFTAVHLTHPGDGDLDLMRERGATLCVCPTTELDLGDGFLPASARAGVRLCIGTDSHARIDPLEEARSVELHARALLGCRQALSAREGPGGLARRILEIASVEGARSLGADPRGIGPGAPADLVALDLARPAAEGVPPLEAAAFVAGPEWVQSLWVGGRRIVHDGAHPERARILASAKPWLQHAIA